MRWPHDPSFTTPRPSPWSVHARPRPGSLRDVRCPSRLRCPPPVPAEGEVLVRVEAASVNARDWHIMRGEPRIARLMDRSIFGWTGPRVRVRGTDFAGVVEGVGPAVADWAVGDRVFGEASATLAEYVAAPVGAMARVPDGVSMEQAAALPLAATTALECLRSVDPRPGSTVLVNGTSGGVGTFVVQLATSMGLRVTAVCSARNVDQARSLGAEAVIDYAKDDFVASGSRTTWSSTWSATGPCATCVVGWSRAEASSSPVEGCRVRDDSWAR